MSTRDYNVSNIKAIGHTILKNMFKVFFPHGNQSSACYKILQTTLIEFSAKNGPAKFIQFG